MKKMDVEVKKIGNSVGIILPKKAQMNEGDKFTLRSFNKTYVLTPKINDIYYSDEFWGNVRNEMTKEETEWDEFNSLPSEVID